MDVAADGHFAASHANAARDVALPDTCNDNFPAVTEAGPYSLFRKLHLPYNRLLYMRALFMGREGRRILYAQATMKVKTDRSSNATPLLHVHVEIHVASLSLSRNTFGSRSYGTSWTRPKTCLLLAPENQSVANKCVYAGAFSPFS